MMSIVNLNENQFKLAYSIFIKNVVKKWMGMTGTRITRLKKLSKSILTSNVSLCVCINKISTNLSNFILGMHKIEAGLWCDGVDIMFHNLYLTHHKGKIAILEQKKKNCNFDLRT